MLYFDLELRDHTNRIGRHVAVSGATNLSFAGFKSGTGGKQRSAVLEGLEVQVPVVPLEIPLSAHPEDDVPEIATGKDGKNPLRKLKRPRQAPYERAPAKSASLVACWLWLLLLPTHSKIVVVK